MIKPSECRCKMCVKACRKPAHIQPDDDYWIARFLKIPREQLIKEKFIETPVAIVRINGQELVMRALRPKTENGWCVFFKDGLCTIHSVKPFGCKYASCKTTFEEQQEIFKYLSEKWYYHNLIDNKLETFDTKNIKQMREVFAELK